MRRFQLGLRRDRGAKLLRFLDLGEAMAFLQGAACDPDMARHLRETWVGLGHGAGRHGDRQVFQGLAALILEERLWVTEAPRPSRTDQPEGDGRTTNGRVSRSYEEPEPPEPPPPIPAPGPRPLKMRPPPAPTPAPAQTQPAIDAARQVAALKAAARLGTPFCETCHAKA